MNLNPFHLLGKIKRKVARWLLALTSGRGGQCDTQKKANRDAWLERTLANIPPGQRMLDAGAGELQYKRFYAHLPDPICALCELVCLQRLFYKKTKGGFRKEKD